MFRKKIFTCDFSDIAFSKRNNLQENEPLSFFYYYQILDKPVNAVQVYPCVKNLHNVNFVTHSQQ